MESPALFSTNSQKEVLMQGSKEVVGMGKPGAVRVVRRDTHRVRKAFTLVVGNAHEERRFDDFEDDVEVNNAVAWAGVIGSLFPEIDDSLAKPLKTTLGRLMPPEVNTSTTNNS